MKKIITYILVLMLIFSITSYSQNEEPDNNSEFEQYRNQVIEIYGKLKPVVKNIVSILKKVNNSEQLEENKNSIINEIKIMVPDALKLQNLSKRIPSEKRFAFFMWTVKVDPEMGRISIELRNERNRIKQISGCAEIMAEIDKKAKEFGRQAQE